MPPTLNSCNLTQCHLRRIGPSGTISDVPDIMEFYRVTYVIGRNPASMDYVLDSDDEQQSKMISRCHARIVRQAGNVHRLYDDSMNGMFVNNIKIADTVVLNEGDRVTFGHLRGAKLAAGTKVRQPDSEYQFIFETCHCQPIIKELDSTVGADEDSLVKNMPEEFRESLTENKACADKSATILSKKEHQAVPASLDTTLAADPSSTIVNQTAQPLTNDSNSKDGFASAYKSQDSEVDKDKIADLPNNLEGHSVIIDEKDGKQCGAFVNLDKNLEWEYEKTMDLGEVPLDNDAEHGSGQEFDLSYDSESDEEVEASILSCCTQKILSDSSFESTDFTTVAVSNEECKMPTSAMVGETEEIRTVMDKLLTDVETVDATVKDDARPINVIECKQTVPCTKDRMGDELKVATSALTCSGISQQKISLSTSLEVAAPSDKGEILDKECATSDSTKNVDSEEILEDHATHFRRADAETMPDMELGSEPEEDTASESMIVMENTSETASSEVPQDIGRTGDPAGARAEVADQLPMDMDSAVPTVGHKAASEPMHAAAGLPVDASICGETCSDEQQDESNDVDEATTGSTVKDALCSKSGRIQYLNDPGDENTTESFVPDSYDDEHFLEPMDSDNFDDDETPPLSCISDDSASMSPTVPLQKQDACITDAEFDDVAPRGDNGDVSLMNMDDSDATPPMSDFSDFEDNDIDMTHCSLFTSIDEDKKTSKMIRNDLPSSFSESNLVKQMPGANESLQQLTADAPSAETPARDCHDAADSQKMIVAIPYHTDIRESLLEEARTTPTKRKQVGVSSDILTSFSTAISSESPAKRQKLMTDFSFKSPLPKAQKSSLNVDEYEIADDIQAGSETDEMLDHSTQSIHEMSDSQFSTAAKSLDFKIAKGSRSSESRDKARKILERLRQKRKSAAKPTNIFDLEPRPGTSEDSAFQDDLSYEEETTNQLVPYEGNRAIDRINEYTARCSDILKMMQRKFRGLITQRNNPRVQAWMKTLDDLDAKRKLPDTVIAVVGDTGAGKSSLMNAILDHASVLPTSGMRACTAVVVEVVENTRNKNYEAEIIFLSKQEWQQELEVLLNDLSGPDGKVRRGQPDPKTEAGVAFSKIRAVYGKVAEVKVLSRISTITTWLGRTKHISTRRAADFRQQIDCYIESTDLGTGGQYWPIVKHVKVMMPNCDVCSSGAILVDLPGVRDSNAARDKIAKEYLKNCNTVWVVASIHRAIDDRTAKDLLGESFRRQLLMDGQYGSVAFVCTKTDVLTPSEIIGSLHIEEECQPLESEIAGLEMEKYDCEREERSNLKEIKRMSKELKTMEDECEELRVDMAEAQSLLEHPDSEEDDHSDEKEQLAELESDLQEKEMCINETRTSIASKKETIYRLPPKILELESEILSRRKSLTAMCAKARNEYSKTQIRKDFKAGLREMKRKAGDGQDESDDEDDWLSDDGDDSDHEIGSSADNLEVFCVSSTEYQKMRKLLKDGPPQVFSSLEETQIPTLKAHVHEMTAVRRRQGAERLIRNLGHFLFDLESYITDDGTESEGTRNNAKFAIDDHFKRIDGKFDPILSKLSSDITDIFDHSLGSKVQIGVNNAIGESGNACAKWGAPKNKENRQAGGLHHCTYKATCNRYGMYTSPTYGPIDFNDQLAGPMCSAMMICWDKVFSGILWAMLEKTCASIQQSFVDFTGQIRLELNQLGVHVDRVERVNTQLLHTAKNKLAEMMGNLKVHITEKQRAVSRTVVPNIQESMKPVYVQCQGERGPGMFARMKAAMSLGIDYKKDTMYSAASLAMMQELCGLQVEIVAMVKAVCNTLCSELRASYEPLWEAPETARCLRKALHADVTELCEKIRVLFTDASIALPERRVVIRQDVQPPRASVTQNIINSAPAMHPVVLTMSNNKPACVRPATSCIPATVTRMINPTPSCGAQSRPQTTITVSKLQPMYNQAHNIHLNAADVLLMSEIELLNSVDEIKKALLIHRLDIPKCVKCLEKLTTLSITSSMLAKNPYVMDTIKTCRKYTGSVLVRSKAEVVYQKLLRLPGHVGAERQLSTNSKENHENKIRPEATTLMKGTSQNTVLQPISGVQPKKEVSNTNVKTEDDAKSYCTMFANKTLGRKIKQEPVLDAKPNMGGSAQSPIIVIDATSYQQIKQEPEARTKRRKRYLGMMDLTDE